MKLITKQELEQHRVELKENPQFKEQVIGILNKELLRVNGPGIASHLMRIQQPFDEKFEVLDSIKDEYSANGIYFEYRRDNVEVRGNVECIMLHFLISAEPFYLDENNKIRTGNTHKA